MQTETEQGIHLIDSGFKRPGFDAAYLMVESGRAAFIDTGTWHTVPRLLRALERCGLQPSNVDWVILTHVHLDHAGGAGELMRHLPRARLVVHPRGARHMIDPSKLWASATAVYGEAVMHRDYGEIVPVPAERVVEAKEGLRLELAGRELLCLDTPGHARHHICIWDAKTRCFFTGDAFGLSYRELDTEKGAFILPTTTPVQFDPQAMHASIDRLLGLDPKAMYLAHFGRVTEIARLGVNLHRSIDVMVDAALACADSDDLHDCIATALFNWCVDALRRHGVVDPETAVQRVLADDIELNTQGLLVWLEQAHG